MSFERKQETVDNVKKFYKNREVESQPLNDLLCAELQKEYEWGLGSLRNDKKRGFSEEWSLGFIEGIRVAARIYKVELSQPHNIEAKTRET